MNIPLNIDWQQIFLHFLNFAILAFGLYLLLYKPVKDFMEKRESYYRSMDQEARNRLENAKQTEAEYRERLRAVEAEIAEKHRIAREAHQQISDCNRQEAEKQAERIIADAQKEAQRMRERILMETQKEASEIAVSAVQKLLSQSVSSSYDEFLEIAERSVAHEQV